MATSLPRLSDLHSRYDQMLRQQMGLGPPDERVVDIPPGATRVRITWSGEVKFSGGVLDVRKGLLAICHAIPRLPDESFPKTMGWRGWLWNTRTKYLYSPQQRTLWRDAELRAPSFDKSKSTDGHAGIHAALVPLGWRTLENSYASPLHMQMAGALSPLGSMDHGLQDQWVGVSGIVERFGKFVLGEKGWRAEWVFIRKLIAPTTDIGLELERAYPNVEVIYNEASNGHR